MTLSAGTTLGGYRVVGPLGAGGMGQVYRASDTTLGRDVALKLLPASFTGDADRLARFRREAQVLASLNHPHIGAIYGLHESDGCHFLVLELVDGPTLAGRIASSALPIDETLGIAREIAEALEAAHDQGIVHRDLKPANIALTRSGQVKVLDFGLAKAAAVVARLSAVTDSPTLPVVNTAAGLILGTAAYMSPEQARGQPTDRTTDVWAFGCVLYEMLTGRAAFDGATVSDLLASVLKSEPDWGRLPAATPEAIRRLLRRCLLKDPTIRLRDLRDARLEIDDAASGAAAGVLVPAPVPRLRQRRAWAAALLFAMLAAVGTLMWAFRPVSRSRETRLDIATPPTTDLVSIAIAPDAQKVVFVGTSDGRPQLLIRQLDADSSRPLEGTDRATLPFWSPDSRSIGFFADGKLKRVDIDGGSPTVLADAPFGRGGSWSADGTILFVAVPAAPVLRTVATATGGSAAAVTSVNTPHQVGHMNPQFLPDGRHFLYYADGSAEASGVFLGQLGTADASRLLMADAAAVYVSSGHLLFIRGGTLFAQAFDAGRLALNGDPLPVAQHVSVDSESPIAPLSASAAGTFVYRAGASVVRRQLAWFDPAGAEISTLGDADTVLQPGAALSPDARRVAVFTRVNGNIDIFLLESGRAVLNRLTTDPADDIFPVWSPDGTRIAFSSTRNRSLDLFVKTASAAEAEEVLVQNPEIKAASDWSRDGRYLLYSSGNRQAGFDIWALSITGDRTPFPVVRTKASERLAQFSPDGKWIAYESDESGRSEIYVRPFLETPGRTGAKQPVSDKGGAQARWQPDGKGLFYIALDERLMFVPLRFSSNGESVESGTPVPRFLTHVRGALQPFPRFQYSVAADGRFLMYVERDAASAPPITVVLNWAGGQK